MRRKFIWVLVSCLMAGALVLASCGEAVEEEEVADEETGEEIPQYGGTLTITWYQDVRSFDNAYFLSTGTLRLTNEEIFKGDWARGPAGTNEVSWRLTSFPGVERYSDKGLAESWEITGDNNEILRLNIRRGVHFHDKAPTNGRELVADDIIFSIDRTWTNPMSIMGQAYPAPVSMTALDDYTVLVEYANLSALSQALVQVCDMNEMWPRDAVEAKNNDMRDWHDSIGTGPFMLTNYVKGGSIELERFSNYWGKDPVGPGKGNQLPYLDQVKILIIPDKSTRMAALRTAKSDHDVLTWEDAATLRKSNPELEWSRAFAENPYDIYMRIDNPEFPWADINVRKALHMAVDFKAIADEFYGGEAAIYHYPFPAYDEAADFRVPFDDLPESVKELFDYDLDKAKQLMADAGYGDGFDMEIICRTQDVDLLSIYKDYWEKLNVNLIIDPKETAVYNSIRSSRETKNAIYALTSMQVAFDMVEVNPTHAYNYDMIDDAYIWGIHDQIWAEYMDWDKRCQLYKDGGVYILEHCWMIPCPQPYNYTLWQPWLKNYHGEMSVGNTTQYNWPTWVWIDQDLKAEMTK